MSYRRMCPDEQWAKERLQGLPPRWRVRIERQWRERHAARNIDARRVANLFLLNITENLKAIRLPLKARDEHICACAEDRAAECLVLASVYREIKQRRAALERVVRRFHCEPPEPERVSIRTGEIIGMRDEPAILRMTDAKWWRSQLRKMHAQFVEAAAIQLDYVNAQGDIYVSNESFARRGQQKKRNRRMLENTIATNEDGDSFPLSELHDKSVSCPQIKRGELMTRIKGFEDIARENGHVGLFLTITCPSRMHRFTKGKKVRLSKGRLVQTRNQVRSNPRYDDTLPREAQRYLSAMFARLRSFLKRHGVQWYGFRIAEPNHDGTPHWHLLVFFPPHLFRRRRGVREPGQRGRVKDVFAVDERCALLPRLCAWVRRYALMDSPDERGAKHHRVDFKPIDWERGTAAGYIAKYVAKNIDGHGIESDLAGNPGLETALRVEAWASTWRIRQFQQVGGPPVTTWREARRLDKVPEGAPKVLDEMYAAVNRIQRGDDETDVSPASWADYVRANGGIHCSRDDRPVRVYREFDSRIGRYGEPVGDVVKGLEAREIRMERDGIVELPKFRSMVVFTSRHTWTIERRKPTDLALDLARHSGAQRLNLRVGLARLARPWTRVNNCTHMPPSAAGAGHEQALDPDITDWLADYDRADLAARTAERQHKPRKSHERHVD
ncbi:replication endonuclease [Paraburkholderia antibiotica]|uniref:Replication endonuclease n=1 Tax=Paraburkholderia antibiotica TaxID=2728839 RepID=A0A7X9X5J1_9BURK|nr:replication endonuclease [Paraburkholderia antibiotica]NML31805.1 replication endonuclease [Paraburkholderia antibiotica]